MVGVELKCLSSYHDDIGMLVIPGKSCSDKQVAREQQEILKALRGRSQWLTEAWTRTVEKSVDHLFCMTTLSW